MATRIAHPWIRPCFLAPSFYLGGRDGSPHPCLVGGWLIFSFFHLHRPSLRLWTTMLEWHHFPFSGGCRQCDDAFLIFGTHMHSRGVLLTFCNRTLPPLSFDWRRHVLWEGHPLLSGTRAIELHSACRGRAVYMCKRGQFTREFLWETFPVLHI